MLDMKLVKIAYSAHKSHAKQRGIEFKMTFDEWWGIWKPHWHLRGNGVGQLMMCRTMDKGAYEVGNVRLDTQAGNARTRSYVAYDRRMEEVKRHNKPVIDEESKAPEEETWESRWLPEELQGYSHFSVFE
jgi:hypothetical protein